MSVIRNFVISNRKAARWLDRKFPSIFGQSTREDDLLFAIRNDVRKGMHILEVGGIDRPMLRKDQDYTFDGLDIDEKENCLSIYDSFLIQSIEEPIDKSYDLIISTTLLEHVPDNRASIRNIYSALNPGGKTLHYIPSKWHPYSICLRIVGPKWQKRLIPILRPGSEGVTGYPAFFDNCSPQAMESLFRSTGFDSINVTPYYRANDYFSFFIPFYVAASLFENLCKLINARIFASGFIICGEKT